MSYRGHFRHINRAPFCGCSEGRAQGSPNCSDSCPKLEQFSEPEKLSGKECAKPPFTPIAPLTSADVHRECGQHLHSGVISHPSEMLATWWTFHNEPLLYTFFLKFHNFWTSSTPLMDNVRLCDKKFVCIPRKEHRGWGEVGGETQLIPCQSHRRSHQATSPEED